MEVIKVLYNRIWKEQKIPEDWEVGILVPLYKKGDNKECKSYRGITLLSTMLKIYERILEKRLKVITEIQLDEAQCGFRKGRGVQDNIFTLKQLIEKYTDDDNIYVAFIDIEKAFDCVPRDWIWKCLSKRGINSKLKNAIASIYRRTRNYVRVGGMQSEEFLTKEGLRQGGVLSPTLFNIVLDDILKEIKKQTRKIQIGYKNMRIVEIAESAFADDLLVYARNVNDLQVNLSIWETALKKRNMRINAEKTKVMSIGKHDRKIVTYIDGKVIEQVEIFKYLGISIHQEGKEEAEINNRIESGIKLYYAMNKAFITKREISKKAKITVFNTIFKPILTYGSESWILNNQTKSKIQALEMRYLRAVKGVTRRDRIKNEKIREELGVEPILQSIERQKLKWFGHMTRMEEERLAKRVWLARPRHKRKRGRPRKTWDSTVEESLRKRGISWNDARRMAKNKKEWSLFIYNKK